MKDAIKSRKSGTLPPYLEICVQKGMLDERTAKRIELHRRTRGLGIQDAPFTLLTTPPDPYLTFENFVTCRGNSFAAELAQTVASQSPESLPYNPVYFYGDVGLGKTHLLSAIANWASDKLSFVINAADLEIEMESARSKKARTDLRRWLSSAEILLLDDIQLCEGREGLQREIFAILNHLIRGHRWAVISSDVPPTRLAGIEKRLLSRLQGGVIVSLQMGDKEERIAAVHHFLGGYPAAPAVVDYLADRLSESMRRLRGIVNQLVAMAQSANRAITVEMAQSIVTGSDGVTTPNLQTFEIVRSQENLEIPTSDAMSNSERDAKISDIPRMAKEDSPPEVDSCIVESVEKIALLDHIGAVAAVQDERIILGIGSKLPDRQVGCLAKEAALFYAQYGRTHFVGLVGSLTLAFPSGFTAVALQRAGTTFVVVLTKKGKPALCLPEIQDLLPNQSAPQ
jgi:chromosomal replication initiator protein DnaA